MSNKTMVTSLSVKQKYSLELKCQAKVWCRVEVSSKSMVLSLCPAKVWQGVEVSNKSMVNS